MKLKEEFYKKLNGDKIKINWNKNPIEMKLFLSFLTVEVKRSQDHLGSDNGWTQLKNDELKLVIGGGIVNGKEYLDYLKFGTNLDNRYNNFVNPFFIFEILTREGQAFFVEYYNDEITKLVELNSSILLSLESQVEKQKQLLSDMISEYHKLNQLKNQPSL